MSSEDNEDKKKKKRGHEEEEPSSSTKRQKEEKKEGKEEKKEGKEAAHEAPAAAIVEAHAPLRIPNIQERAISHFRALQATLDDTLRDEDGRLLFPQELFRGIIDCVARSDRRGNVFEAFLEKEEPDIEGKEHYHETNLGILYEESKQLYSIGHIDRKDRLRRGLLLPNVSITTDHTLTLHLQDEKWIGQDLPTEEPSGATQFDSIITEGNPDNNFEIDLKREGDGVRLRGLTVFDSDSFSCQARFGPFRNHGESFTIHSNIQRNFVPYNLNFVPVPLEVLNNYYVQGFENELSDVKEVFYGMPLHGGRSELRLSQPTYFDCDFRILAGRMIFSQETREMKHEKGTDERERDEVELNISGEVIYSVLDQEAKLHNYTAHLQINSTIELFEMINGGMVRITDITDEKYELIDNLQLVMSRLVNVSDLNSDELQDEATRVGTHVIDVDDYIGPLDICWVHNIDLGDYLQILARLFEFFSNRHIVPDLD